MSGPDRYFRHTDGGLYRFVAYARSADTTKDVVVYEHLWPYDQGLWVRDREEFEARFDGIDADVVEAEMQLKQSDAQAKVSSAKAARRAAR
ncbi:MAG TPA: DUF1653 domain-containing protein, partial [Steroidobacteraceae bacterium]|nr:DUF1653 domain-containing protein [Steroidobacteraceae bacterium]